MTRRRGESRERGGLVAFGVGGQEPPGVAEPFDAVQKLIVGDRHHRCQARRLWWIGPAELCGVVTMVRSCTLEARRQLTVISDLRSPCGLGPVSVSSRGAGPAREHPAQHA
jgi:hypothetical protein